ncbi:MaoC/PaaZ C-terminal domain-containing protein [Streptomyces sp. LBL]|uniref:MaoC family dehydratase n=1 Tax=Streptomyces sp. LBL TaxID=2940562 RepID=UPI002476E433|nr:MaoC/PaaZ C-terminal domain-containing protein [Streptomyces sp. LBL]
MISTSYEDIRIGDIAKTGFVTVTEEYVRGFADLTGDRHPLHLDPEYAARTRFGQRIAHGALMMSTLLGLVELHPSYLQCFYDRAVAPHGKGRQLAESIDAPLL